MGMTRLYTGPDGRLHIEEMVGNKRRLTATVHLAD